MVQTNSPCVGLEQDENRVELNLANGDRIQGDALIGADGIHSTVRRTLLGPIDRNSPDIWRGAA